MCAPCGNTAVHVQAMLNVCREAAMEEGDVPDRATLGY